MNPLFVVRDPLNLIETEGRVEVLKEVPDFLRKNPLMADPYFFNLKILRYNESLPVREDGSPSKVFSSPNVGGYKRDGVPALWSGHRSCITLDSRTEQMYRLKGIAFGIQPKFT